MKDITHLVFSGCAFRSVCLLGVLRYLYIEKKHLNIHNVAGSSMGSLFCLVFALKIPYEKIEDIIKKTISDEEISNINKDSLINIFYKNGIESSKKYLKPTSIKWVFCLDNFLKAKRINTLKFNLSTSYLYFRNK